MTALSITARVEIQDLLARYAWALDTADVEAFVACFAAEGELVWDSFEPAIHCRGADQLRRFIQTLRDLPDSAGRQHHVSNVLVAGAGGHAQSRAFVLVSLRAEDGSVQVRVAGYYDDELCIEHGEWRIRRRTIRDWAGPVLREFAGQTGERVTRPLPQVLEVLAPRDPAQAG